MKRNLNPTFGVVLAALLAAIFTLNAVPTFAQNGYNDYYGNGACEPAACEPTCVAPSCDVPTCGPEACEPVGCGYYGGISCDSGYCGTGCCLPCCDVSTLVGGVLNVATTPICWVASMLTDGIYPGCGCAPAPAKTPCNPCDLCGNYVGGCNDCCQSQTPNYAGGTVDVYGDPVARAGSSAAPGSYSNGYYDSESYDASPSRQKTVPGVQSPAPNGNASPENLPAEAVNPGGYTMQSRPNFNAQAFNVRQFNVQSLVGNVPSGVRQTSYSVDRAVRYPVSNAAPRETVVFENVENVRNVPTAQNLQGAPVATNVQGAPIVSNAPVRKTYGQARPNQTTGARSLY